MKSPQGYATGTYWQHSCELRNICCYGLTWQPATQHWTAAHSPLPFPLSGMGWTHGQKRKLLG